MAATKKTTSATPAKRQAASKPAVKKAAPKRASASRSSSSPPARKAAVSKTPSPAKKSAAKAAPAANGETHPDVPASRGVNKDGIAYTKDFDVKFLKSQKELLLRERAELVGQADRLEDEANSLIEDGEMGDVQFDDESGEGDTMVVERERDLAISAQARQTVADIDAALERIANGTYGYSVVSGAPIPRERLEAIPWATELVEEKVGGIGRR
jgi:RNA polymerase-binding transcription factor DksA